MLLVIWANEILDKDAPDTYLGESKEIIMKKMKLMTIMGTDQKSFDWVR